MMKFRWPQSLLAKVIGWLVLHLLILGAAFAAFLGFQLRLGLDSLLSGRTGQNLRILGDKIGGELRTTPRRDWSAILAQNSKSSGLVIDLWEQNGGWKSGVFTRVPPNVMERLKDVRLPPADLRQGPGGRPPRPNGGGPFPPPRHPEGPPPFEEEMDPLGPRPQPEADPPPNNREPANTPVDRLPPATKPAFFLRGAGGDGYWAAIDIPLNFPRNQVPQHGVLLLRSHDISGNGLLFQLRPWVLGALAVIGFSILFWIPFVMSITRYLRRLTQATEQIADGKFQVSLPSARGDELGRLGSAVSEMAGKLDHFVSGQRRFLADVAHELCAPLARLRTGLAVLDATVPEERRSSLNSVEEDAGELATLIEEVLAFSRAGVSPAKLREIALAEILPDLVAREAGQMPVRLEIPAECVALGDPRLISRAFGNLIRNARLHAGPEASLTIHAKEQDRYVHLSFRDNGPGVPKEELTRLFEPFYRPDRSRTRDTGGNGLGLAIVRSGIESCGGRVYAQIPESGGFEVIVELLQPSESPA